MKTFLSFQSRRGFALEAVLIGVGLVTLGFALLKPRFADGDSRRADRSNEASAQVETATAAALEAAAKEKAALAERLKALEAQSSSAAAGVVKVGEANTLAPDSPAKDFIGREVPAILAKLPSADLAALLQAEQRRAAVMSGDLKRADALYQREAAEAERLRAEMKAAAERERAAAAEALQAKADLAKEQAERRRVDAELQAAAAEKLALARQSARQRLALWVLAAVVVLVWFSGVSPLKIGRALAAVRAGTDPHAAFDGVLPEWMQPVVRWERRREQSRIRRDAVDELPAHRAGAAGSHEPA